MKTTTRKPNLSNRAFDLAKRIRMDPRRILGVLGCGGKNRPWARAVAKALLKLGIGNGVTEAWKKTKNTSGLVIPDIVKTVLGLITVWAHSGVDIIHREDPEESVPDGPLGVEDDSRVKADVIARSGFMKVLVSNRLVAPLRAVRVCPFCVFDKLRVKKVQVETKPTEPYPDLFKKLESGNLNGGWLEAAALAHNKEMHSDNGNGTLDALEDFLSRNGERGSVIKACMQQFWDKNTEMCNKYADATLNSTRLEDNLPVLYYCRDALKGSQALATAGTFYQTLHYHSDHPRAVATDSSDTGVDSTSGTTPTVESDMSASSPSVRVDVHAEDPDAIITLEDPPVGNGGQGGTPPASVPPSPSRGSGKGKEKTLTRSSSATSNFRTWFKRKTTESQTSSLPPKTGTASLNNQATPPPGPAMQDQAVQDTLGRLRWSGVGTNPQLTIGLLTHRAELSRIIEAASSSDPTHPNALNPAKSKYMYGVLADTPNLGIMAELAIKDRLPDHRKLLLRAALYDRLREKRFLHPTGVNWAWPRPNVVHTGIVTLEEMGDWGYKFGVCTTSVIDWALKSQGVIPVGGGARWALADCVIIPISANSSPSDKGFDMWILSQLSYPLAWVTDTYNISRIGYGAEDETFVRTESLVDIHCIHRNILFVVVTDTLTQVDIGGRLFPVTTTNRYGQVPPDFHVPVADFDPILIAILRRVLTSEHFLRVAFSNYVAGYFTGSCHWVEIDVLVNLLTSRWHQAIEGRHTSLVERDPSQGSVTRYQGAPSTILRLMHLPPDEGVRPDSYDGYGCLDAVNPMDQRYVTRAVARTNPMIYLGEWTGLDSLLVATYARYETNCPSTPVEIGARAYSGGIDATIRTPYFRKAWEQFRTATANTEAIAFPFSADKLEGYWPSLIGLGLPKEEGCTAQYFADTFLPAVVVYNWVANLRAPKGGCTWTGYRTISSWWRAEINTEWCDFNIAGTGRDLTAYAYYDTRYTWYKRYYVQSGHGEDNPVLQAALDRLDHTVDWGLSYLSHPMHAQKKEVSFVVDQSYGGILAWELGWKHGNFPSLLVDTWGWNVIVRKKDHAASTLLTIAIPRNTATVLQSKQFSRNTILYRGSTDQTPVSIGQCYVDRMCGIKPLTFSRNLGNSSSEKPAPSLSRAEEILSLQKRLEKLQAPQDLEARHAANFTEPAMMPWQSTLTEDDGKRRQVTQPSLSEQETVRGQESEAKTSTLKPTQEVDPASGKVKVTVT